MTDTQIQLIRSILAPGEILHWVGHESRSRYLLSRFLVIIYLSLFSGVAGILFVIMFLLNPDFLRTSFYNILPVLTPFTLAIVGIILLFIYIFRPVKRAPEIYALTTCRAIIVSPGKTTKSWKYTTQDFARIQIKRRKDGSGDIIFERRSQWSSDAQGRTMHKFQVIGFYGVKDVDEVYQRVHQLIQSEQLRFKE